MKLKQKKNTKLLSDKIADALTLKPRADIEDDQVFGTKPKTLSRVDFEASDSEDEAAISDFRKRNQNLLSEVSKKYEGEVVSKKDLAESGSEESDDSSDNDNVVSANGKHAADEESSESENEAPLPISKLGSDSDDDNLDSDGGESDDYSITNFQQQIKKQMQSDDENDDDDEDDESGDDDDDDEGEGYDISQMEEPMKEEFESVKKKNLSEDAKKGVSVRNQLLVWEGLLEMRIHLQRCMSTANQMPLPDTHSELKQNDEFVTESNATRANVANVLEKLINLQDLLLKKYPETKSLSTKKQGKEVSTKEVGKPESDEEIPSDTDNEEIPSDTEPEDNEETETKPTQAAPKMSTKKRKLEDYESDLSTTHKSLKNFRDTTINKWSDKTRLATASSMKTAPTTTVLQQISYILSDREKLVKRTQLKRSEFDIVGYKKPVEEEVMEENELNPVTRSRKDDDEYIPEIFDDSDFYHQLLRELIECKSADISDPVQLSRQWIALQQMRSKMKRKVDTKATKGRKIKYVVHNPLVNFMGPEKCITWNDEGTNELFSSLFGKMFERNNAGMNGDVGNVFKLN